jgi:hypothetical protein
MNQSSNTDSQVKRKCVFVRNPESGEPAYFCGTLGDLEDVKSGITNLTLAELDEIFYGHTDKVTLEFEIWEMTDDEISNLADV